MNCSICKNECEYDEFAVIEACWGYFSNNDGEKHNIVLCEKCYDKIIEKVVEMGGNVDIHNYLWHSKC